MSRQGWAGWAVSRLSSRDRVHSASDSAPSACYSTHSVRAVYMRQTYDSALGCVLFGLLCMYTIGSLFMDNVYKHCS